MGKDSGQGYLSGKLLIAMPDMRDLRFKKSIVLMVEHSDENAMGVVVNKVAGHMQIGSAPNEGGKIVVESEPVPVHFGGPVEHERAIILHSGDSREYRSTKIINDDFRITMTPDILEDFSRGEGPSRMILALGYAGWGPGQLESELQENAWLICDGDPIVVFDTDDDQKWEAALKSMGINPGMLAAVGGSA